MSKKIDFQVGPTALAMNTEGLQDRMIRAGLEPAEVHRNLIINCDWFVEQGVPPESIQEYLLDRLDFVIRYHEAHNPLS